MFKYILNVERWALVILCLSAISTFAQNNNAKSFNDGFVAFEFGKLTAEQSANAKAYVEKRTNYDDEVGMLKVRLHGWNYHTDAQNADNYHPMRDSFYYLIAILNTMDDKYLPRAEKMIEVLCSLQEKDKSKPFYGVWPYYREEPLDKKKTSVDYNWADFCSVPLIEIYINHKDRLSQKSLDTIKSTLILASEAIQKRNVSMGYTNIAIMGTYVTYMVSHIYNVEPLKVYAADRLVRFYNHIMENGTFDEFNSPTYTIVALEALYSMKKYVIETNALKKIDELIYMEWKMIARHWHSTSNQWAGPHSRSYFGLLSTSVTAFIDEALNGALESGCTTNRAFEHIYPQVPKDLVEYFTNPKYPRVEKDLFVIRAPKIEGVCYLTKEAAFSTLNRSLMWNQRRPFLVFFGDKQTPKYIKLRFMCDHYDNSLGIYYGKQIENKAISLITCSTTGGIKHPWMNYIENGTFNAKDLRIRFEFGNCSDIKILKEPKKFDDKMEIEVDSNKFFLHMPYARFGDLPNGKWVKTKDKHSVNLEYIIYSGKERSFDLSKMDSASFIFTFMVNNKGSYQEPEIEEDYNKIECFWENMKLKEKIKPYKRPSNL